MTHLAHTVDFICPMARTVEETALLLTAIAGDDWRDPQWVRGAITVDDYLARLDDADLSDLRIAVVREGFPADVCELAVRENLERTADALRGCGATVESTSIPIWEYGAKITQTLLSHLTSDMIRSEGDGRDHLGLIDVDRLAAFATKRRTQGALLPPYFKAWLITERYLHERYLGIPYATLHNLRLRVRRSIDEALSTYDVLLTPTTATTAPPLITDGTAEEIVNRVLGSAPYNTAPLNLSGHPALSVPNGADDAGLPTAAQVIGRRFDEARVLQVGRVIESENQSVGGAAALTERGLPG
jgi:amidase